MSPIARAEPQGPQGMLALISASGILCEAVLECLGVFCRAEVGVGAERVFLVCANASSQSQMGGTARMVTGGFNCYYCDGWLRIGANTQLFHSRLFQALRGARAEPARFAECLRLKYAPSLIVRRLPSHPSWNPSHSKPGT